MIRAAPALAAVLILGGCATDRLTLLDNEAGSETGAVAVLAPDGREIVVDRANSEAALRGGSARIKPVKQIKPAYATLIGSLPPAARPFAITFDTGQSRIPDTQRAILAQIRTELSTRPGAQIEVVGFTDSEGGEARNDAISRERAQAVAEQLREFGFAVDPDDAIGRGEDEARKTLGDGVRDEAFRKVVVIVR